MTTAALPALDVAGRIDRLRELIFSGEAGEAPEFPEAGIDALFVTRLVNIRYLTGFTGSAWRPTASPGRSSGASPRSGSPPPSWSPPRV